MADFKDFGLSETSLRAIEELGFFKVTPIQGKAIPVLLNESRDFIGLAHTGTGKTAAFGIPLVEKIEIDKRYIQGLVLAPTRELIKQIATQLSLFAKYKKGLRVETVYGGTSISAQIKSLRRPPHILMATPGRLIDLVNRNVIQLKDLAYIVLDEADEMLNMGFKEEIDTILSHSGGKHNTWLFSATFPKEIRRITSNYMNNPLEFAVDSVKELNASIDHRFSIVKGARKVESLKRILDANASLRGIVFCRTKRGTQGLADELSADNYKVDALHGDMSQAQRDRVMKKFKAHQLQVLIATDVAARGIDVKDLSHIIHYDLPDDISYYTHRSGRTGRAGKTGISLVFIPPSNKRRLSHIERSLRIKFKQAKIPSDGEVVKLRLFKWAEDVAQSKEIDGIETDIIAQVYSIFDNFSKDELVEKFIMNELRLMNYKPSGYNDTQAFSASSNQEKKPKVKKKSKKESKRGKKRYEESTTDADRDTLINLFINVGFIDGIGKRDLLTFLMEQTNIDIEHFQNLDMKKKHSFFDIPAEFQRRVIASFKDISIGNRSLRVNRNQD